VSERERQRDSERTMRGVTQTTGECERETKRARERDRETVSERGAA
jgi:hypothetical protein